MEVTFIGIVTALLGLGFLRWKPRWLIGLVFFLSLFGAASAFNLSALGDASVMPGYAAVGFLGVAVLFSNSLKANFQKALKPNLALIVYALWALVGSYFLPRLFNDAISLPPMQMADNPNLFYSVPLGPSSRNVTQAVYIAGTCFAAILSFTFSIEYPQHLGDLVRTILIVGLCHVGFGVLQLFLSSIGQMGLLDILRNGNYAQLDQVSAGFTRISGIFSETSAFSAYGFVLFVFAIELWLRKYQLKLSGLTTLALGAILFFTTSSSAYLGLGSYGLLLGLRIMAFPKMSLSRLPALLAFAFLAILVVLIAATIIPTFLNAIAEAIQTATIGKAGTESSIQRSYWAKSGLDAFVISHGLGVGVGSFRSSSIIAAILGSTGVIGAISFVAYLVVVLRPLDIQTYNLDVNGGPEAIAPAAAWAAAFGLIPSLAASPGADPGLLFGLFSGLALASRYLRNEAQENTIVFLRRDARVRYS